MILQREMLAKQIVDAAFHVHKELGPGLLESVYQICMERELRERNSIFVKQAFLPVIYKGETLDADFRIDLLVASEIVVELKSVEVAPGTRSTIVNISEVVRKTLRIPDKF